MNILPLIVGSIFFAVGINIILGFYSFKRRGQKIKSYVKAIEKYTSITTTDGHRTKSTFYRPLVDYRYKDQTRTVTGIGTNEIRYKLKQAVTVLVIEDQDGTVQARIDDRFYYFMGIIFSMVGLGALLVYVFLVGGSWWLVGVVASGALGVGYMIASMLRGFKTLVTSAEDQQERGEDSVLIETHADFIKEISIHSLWGKIIAYIFMIGALGVIYAGYSGLPVEAPQIIFSDFSAFWTQLTNGDLPSRWEKPLMLCGIGLFFFLASLRSIYYVTKKYSGMMMR